MFFWSKLVDELKKKRHVGECLPFVENKAHMHMLCVYGLTCWRRSPAVFNTTFKQNPTWGAEIWKNATWIVIYVNILWTEKVAVLCGKTISNSRLLKVIWCKSTHSLSSKIDHEVFNIKHASIAGNKLCASTHQGGLVWALSKPHTIKQTNKQTRVSYNKDDS